MTIEPSSRWKKIPAESIFNTKLSAIKAEREKTGRSVLEFVEGDPVLFGHTNQPLSDFLVEAAKEGWHMYPAKTNWRRELTEAISHFERKYRNVYFPPEDVILAPGVAGCFQVLHYTLLDVGDEILAIEPTHYLTGPTSYWHYFSSKVVTCSSEEAKNWDPNLEELRSKITAKTKGIVVVNPNNPTGAIYSHEALKGIIDIAGEYELPIIADEIYGLIAFDDAKVQSMAALAKDVPVIVLNGMSKFFMRAGWRVGYMGFHDPQEKISKVAKVAKKVANLYGHTTSALPTPILVAATRAYRASDDAGKEMVKCLQVCRDFTWKRLNEIEGISCVKPKGALYAFPRIRAVGKNWKTDEDFVLDLLKEEGIMFPPGSIYGRSGVKHFRTLLLPKLETLENVYDKLERFMTETH